MKERMFRFKRFTVRHSESAMPIGVDGVLIGAWAGGTVTGCPYGRPMEILDAGTGCGVIALMASQRFPESRVLGIDIHVPSVVEAALNFKESPWGERLEAESLDFTTFTGRKWDLIVSNPPFFEAGVEDRDTARKTARHAGAFSPYSLIGRSAELLERGGAVALIAPSSSFENLKSHAEDSGLSIRRACMVRDHVGSPWKRVMVEFGHKGEILSSAPVEELTMFGPDREPTDEYRRLCGDFYLRF